MKITASDIDADEIDAATVEYETDMSPDSQALSRAIHGAMRNSEVLAEILRRARNGGPTIDRIGVATQVGIEIGLKLAQNVYTRKERAKGAPHQ